MKKLHFKLAAVAICFLLAAVLTATPLQIVRMSNNSALRLQRNKQGRLDPVTEKALMNVINKVTSFSTMSRRVMSWLPSTLTANQKKKFDKTFQKLLRVSSLKKAGRYRAKGFRYLGVYYQRGAAIVKTKALYKNDTVSLNYTLNKILGHWKIVDYEVDGIKTVSNYKKMFRILFRRKSCAAVIGIMKRRIKKYESRK